MEAECFDLLLCNYLNIGYMHGYDCFCLFACFLAFYLIHSLLSLKFVGPGAFPATHSNLCFTGAKLLMWIGQGTIPKAGLDWKYNMK